MIGDARKRQGERFFIRERLRQRRSIDRDLYVVPRSYAPRRWYDDDRIGKRVGERLKPKGHAVVDIGQDRVWRFLFADRLILDDRSARIHVRSLYFFRLALPFAVRLYARRDTAPNLVETAFELRAIEPSCFTEFSKELFSLFVPRRSALLGLGKPTVAREPCPRVDADLALRLLPRVFGRPSTRNHAILNLNVPTGAIHREGFAATIEDGAADEGQKHAATEKRFRFLRMLSALHDRESHELRAEKERRAKHDREEEHRSAMEESDCRHAATEYVRQRSLIDTSASMPKITATIQNRVTTCNSLSPPMWKWWWIGEQRKIRFPPVHLK